MGSKVKQITLWNQSSKSNWFGILKTGIERRGYHQSQFDPGVIYRK